jgi:hypothetical protein
MYLYLSFRGLQVTLPRGVGEGQAVVALISKGLPFK